MDLRATDVARLLGETEDTVHRWARDGTLPAHRVHEQYCFNRVELQEWATARGRCLSPQLFAYPGNGSLPSVRAAIERGGVYYQVPGKTRGEVLATVACLPGIPNTVDRALLQELLFRRERQGSSAIGEGIAIPHTRDPFIVHIEEPVLLLCFLASPVNFHAADGKPVQVLFTLLSPAVQRHLQLLSRLAFLLHDGPLREMLQTQACAETILTRIRGLEGGATTGP
jgi:nitrogen PTS system EIIA component